MRIAHALPAGDVVRIPPPSTNSRPLSITEAQEARCTQSDPELWFPDPNEHAREAKQICPIAARCLAIALARRPRVKGIWAGTSEHDRNRIHAARRRATATAADVAHHDTDLEEAA